MLICGCVSGPIEIYCSPVLVPASMQIGPAGDYDINKPANVLHQPEGSESVFLRNEQVHCSKHRK